MLLVMRKVICENLIILQNPVSFAMFEQKFATVPLKIPHLAGPLSYMGSLGEINI